MFKQIRLPAVAVAEKAAALPPSHAIAQNLPVERDAAGLPIGFSRELDIDLPRKLYAAWIPKFGERALVRELRADERMRLEGRATALEDALRPFGDDEVSAVEAEIAAMFSGFRAMRQTGDDVAAVVEVTRRVVREFPLWAIAKACLLIAQNQATIDGKPLDRRFSPNDTEIYAVVAGVVKLRCEAMTSARALLAAPVEPPAPARAKDGPEIPRPQRDPQPEAEARHDGKHFQRIEADLAARKARRESAEGISDNG